MNKRTIIHRDYTIEYEKTAERTEITVLYVGSTYMDAFDDSLTYGTDEPMTLHDICAELLEEIQSYLRADPGADTYYNEYTTEALYNFMKVLKQTIKEEE